MQPPTRSTLAKAAAALIGMLAVIGVITVPPDTPGAGRLADTPVVGETLGDLVVAEETSALWECATWGCGETLSYQPWLGKGSYRVNDHYVSAQWPTSQSSVNACTYLVVRRANTNSWYQAGYDCGGSIEYISFDYWFAIDSVVIESKDNRGRWRYKTIDGPTGQR